MKMAMTSPMVMSRKPHSSPATMAMKSTSAGSTMTTMIAKAAKTKHSTTWVKKLVFSHAMTELK